MKIIQEKNKWPLSAVAAIPAAFALWQHFRLTLPFFFLLWPFITVLFSRCEKESDRRSAIICLILSLFFSLSFILAKPELLRNSPFFLLWVLLRFLGLLLFFFSVVSLLFRRLCGFSLLISAEQPRDIRPRRLAAIFLLSFFLILLWFFFWLLYRFPGCMSPDSTWQLLQARGLMPLSNHHPVVHTMIIRLFIRLGAALGNDNPSPALGTYSMAQAAFLAFSFSLLTETMYKLRVRRGVILAIFLSFFLLPYHAAYSITMHKDIWFSSFVLLLCLSLWRLMVHFRQDTARAPVGDLLLLFFSSLGMCLFRTNGLYAFVLLLPFTVPMFFKKNKGASLLPVLALLLALGIRGPLYRSLNIIPPDTIESLSVPAQHVVRALQEGAQLTPEQDALVRCVIDPEALVAVYTPHLADPVKLLIRDTGNQQFLTEHKQDFFRLWLQLGLKHPGAYLRAHVDLTSGYWYPRTDGIVMFPFFTDSGQTMDYCLLPEVLAAIPLGMSRVLPRIPVFNLFFSNGAAVWLYLFLFALCLLQHRYQWLILFLPALGVWVTLLIATPLNNEFRYAYSLFTTLPLVGILPFYPDNSPKSNS